MPDRVTIDRQGPVATVTLNRPARHNALDQAQFEAIVAAGESLKSAQGLRAVVLTGAGDSFCAGLDTGAMAGTLAEARRTGLRSRSHGAANLYQQASLVWSELPAPVIAAVHGHAYGGGLQLMLGADIRVAAPGSRFGILEGRFGLVPDMGLTLLTRGLVRPDLLRRLTWTAEVFGAEAALRWGFVTEIADDPLARAHALAGDIARRAPDAVRAAKRLFSADGPADPAELLMAESAAQDRLLDGPNPEEAARARAEGRPPAFRD